MNRLNRVLAIANLRLETRTAETMEQGRLKVLVERGHFDRPVFPLPAGFEECPADAVIEDVGRYRARLEDFSDAARNDVGYTYDNQYFTSPDAEVLYAMVRRLQPRLIVEVGSGYSTRIIRQALVDGGLKAHLLSIDPAPRLKVTGFAEEIWPSPVEACPSEVFGSLAQNDLLFIDSSHVVGTGNDVVRLYLEVIPSLRPGVLVHIHDVFLPYDYPRDWVIGKGWRWSEQYLVQALLTFGGGLDVLWPGYFVQRTHSSFAKHFPHLDGRRAQSLWLRRTVHP